MKARRLLLLSVLGLVTSPLPLRSQASEPVSVTVFEEAFGRAPGQPSVESRTFTVPAMVKPPYTVEVTNGTISGSARVSSVRILVNGVQLFGPSDVNQRIASLRRSVSLEVTNVLQVELSSRPNSQISIRIQGHLEPDRVTEQATHTVGAQGGVFALPGIATVQVPPNAVSSATVEIATVRSAFVQFLATELDPSISLLDLPALRIKSSAPFRDRLELRLQVPNLAAFIPEGERVGFVAIERRFGANGEAIDGLMTIGGHLCGVEAVCATLSPDWFLPVNPPTRTTR